MAQRDQAGPVIKQRAHGSQGESHLAHNRRQRDGAQEALLSEAGEPNYEGWMRDGVIKGFLERESN